MFDHIGLKTRDLDASIAFYTAALEPLGSRMLAKDEGSAGFGRTAPAFWLYASEFGNIGAHLAVRAPSRQSVDAFHAKALAAGGRDNGPPGIRADYAPNYYAAFVLDLDGNNVEAVCLDAVG